MDFSNVRSIGEIDGVSELDPNTPITRCLRRYQERGISHGAEDDNDFTDRVVPRGIVRSSSFEFVTTMIMSTLLNITKLGLSRAVMEVVVGFRYLYGLIHLNVSLLGEPWMSIE